MNSSTSVYCLLALIPITGTAAELKDPRTRDEDISNTIVTVDYTMRGDGLYEYVYSVASSLNNLGNLSSVVLDLGCENDVPGPVPPAGSGQGYLGNLSGDGKHVPATISADYGQAATYGLSMRNAARWLVGLDPGEASTGLRIVSPATPGMREYRLIPYMDNDPSWDYPDEPDPTIPWIDDFTVTGMIAGPGCPGVSPPVDEPLFAGSDNGRTTPDHINLLLAYALPLKDKLAVDSIDESIVMEIEYSPDIDPKTFKVQPGYLRSLFDPRPGTSQRIEIPLKSAKNMVHLEVRPNSEHGPRKDGPDNKSYMDHDVFEIRRK